MIQGRSELTRWHYRQQSCAGRRILATWVDDDTRDRHPSSSGRQKAGIFRNARLSCYRPRMNWVEDMPYMGKARKSRFQD